MLELESTPTHCTSGLHPPWRTPRNDVNFDLAVDSHDVQYDREQVRRSIADAKTAQRCVSARIIEAIY